MDAEDDDPAARRPLTQILDQKEGVEDVHALRRLVQQNNVRVQQQVASDVEAPPLRQRQRRHPRVTHRTQTQILNQGRNLLA